MVQVVNLNYTSMELENWSTFLFMLILSLAAQFIQSHEQAPTRQTCDEHCCSMGTKTIHIKYYPESKDLVDAERICTKQNSDLLIESMYKNMKTCIHEYLKSKNVNPTGVWLLRINADQMLVFNLTTNFVVAKENHGYSSICIRQETIFKTFSLIVTGNSTSQLKEFDLLTKEVFKDVFKGQNMTLKCEAEGIPLSSMIFKKNGEIIKGVKRNKTSLTTEVSADRCGDLGTFTCENQNTNNYLNKSIQITVSCDEKKVSNVHGGSIEGSPQLCSREDKIKNITVTSGGHAFSFCVIANQSISDFLIFNNTDVFRNNNTRFGWSSELNQGSNSYNITIIIKNITRLTSGDLTIGICTTQGRDYRLNYTVILNIDLFPGNNKNGQDPDKSTPGTNPGIDHLAVAIPVALATAAIVLAICCIVFVVIGVTLYRKRENIIRSIRNVNRTDGNDSKSGNSVELRSTVNVYANIKHNRSSTLETYIRESRPLAGCEETDEQELYSTVNSVNVCADVRSIVKANSSDKLKNAFEETSFTGMQYENVGRGAARPVTCGYSDTGSDSISGEDSGRYISDGLLYITVGQAGKKRPMKPVRAKSEEKVEYAKLDFHKIDKFYKKKHKRFGSKKTREL